MSIVQHNDRFEDWFEKELNKINETNLDYTEWVNLLPEDSYLMTSMEDSNDIDHYEDMLGAISFGASASIQDQFIYITRYGDIYFFFMTHNITDLKKIIAQAIKDWQAQLPPEEAPAPTWNERACILLETLSDSWISDTKGQTDAEAAWVAEIRKLLTERI